VEVDRSTTADKLIDVIERLVVTHGAPEQLRMDNGPELLSWALRDWCRFTGTSPIYIEPGSPWENPFVESFNGRATDELLNIEEFMTLTEARGDVEAWRIEHNAWLPHSSLGGAHAGRVQATLARARPNLHAHNGWIINGAPSLVNRAVIFLRWQSPVPPALLPRPALFELLEHGTSRLHPCPG
jgi:transposase InsO family protein